VSGPPLSLLKSAVIVALVMLGVCDGGHSALVMNQVRASDRPCCFCWNRGSALERLRCWLYQHSPLCM